jgi:hypothetical protein
LVGAADVWTPILCGIRYGSIGRSSRSLYVGRTSRCNCMCRCSLRVGLGSGSAHRPA